ncbi:hypothetical protein QBC32DRAFT_74182 [Pseudoneurospora amorphoporcata]|uniref:DUF829-domain-containing protein n=1 Tax=Pseudoneurospora amorphoporcata TaxID=241081 RepID=A0AAN6SIP7_9PEZI|nr:hypothetical protein QBC32DRAFT_74182 [Pseudoneurospora amorphoporcata]
MSEQVIVDAVVTHSEKKSPLGPGFNRLTEQIYLQEAPSSATPLSPSDPTTILLYGWGDARPKHLAKYVDGYRALFPAAKFVVVLCPILRCLYQTLEARSKAMTPVISACFGSLESADRKSVESSSNNRILVQVMSNTGGMYFAATLNAYRKRFGDAFPHHMLVADSTPGSTSFLQNAGPWSRAMAIGAPGWLPLPFMVTQALACFFLAALHGFGWLIGASSAAAYSVAAVNNDELCQKSARRLYMYSKEDDIIYWEDIEKHAAQARQKGYVVDLDMFEGTPHVGHMRQHPEQYWGAVKKTWTEAIVGL